MAERTGHRPTAPVAAALAVGDGLMALDTRERPWEPNGFERAFRKVLTVDGSGAPAAFISYLPGHFSSGHDLPTRHLHHRVHEFSFSLGGEYPIWQYRDAAQQHGALTILRPGYFFSRLPGSLHGREPGPISHVGFMSLTWRDGTGNWMFEPDFASESAFVGYADDWRANAAVADLTAAGDGTVLRWPDLTVLDTRAMPWTQGNGGVQRKRLWTEPAAELVHLGAGVEHALGGDVENAFVLDGALELGPRQVPAAAHLKLAPEARHTVRGGAAGATLLAWRDP